MNPKKSRTPKPKRYKPPRPTSSDFLRAYNSLSPAQLSSILADPSTLKPLLLSLLSPERPSNVPNPS